MHSRFPIFAWLAGALFSAAAAQVSQPAPRGLVPSPVAGFDYTTPFFPNARHDPTVAAPDTVLGFPAGSQAATHAQIEAVLKALATRGARCRLIEYGRTHEGRALYYLVIASEANLRRLDALKADYARLADPRRISRAEADQLATTLPALAWMAYAIHGDEASAADAAMLVAHHLVASTDAEVRALLDEIVVIIDPLMNPDGRDRFVLDLARQRTSQPNFDDQSALHTGVWPGGRTNHYLFDMNRDWIFATQPETQGRIRAINEWNPHFLVEGHEMGSQSTFAFYPASEAVNLNFPANVRKWEARFATDFAAAFDQRGWRYFNGEPFDNWYPGYSSAWAGLRGTIDNLYEQASIETDAIRRAEGTLHTYRESVHKQIVATMANLTSLSRNRREVLADFVAEKRQCVGPEATVPEQTFVILPSVNLARQNQFTELMALQGIEIATAGAAFTAPGRDRLGRDVTAQSFPAGSLLISSRQPLARLLLALLEFDPRMKPDFLAEERRELLRKGTSRIYDVSGWSLPMLYDLEAFVLAGSPPAAAQVRPLATAPQAPAGAPAKTTVGYLLDGADDRSVVAAGRLLERQIRVRLADKAFQFDGRSFPRGSVLITQQDNTAFTGDFAAAVHEVCRELKLSAVALGTGFGPGELPDLGGRHFRLLHAPRIALLGRQPFSAVSYGEYWYTLDQVLGLRASYLDFSRMTAADLRRYNVIIVPETRSEALKDKVEVLKSWVEGGGTLVAIGSAAAAFARDPGGIGSIRQLPAILGKPEPFLQAVIREWESAHATVEEDKVWSFTAPSGESATRIPWQGAALRIDKDDKPSEDELKRRDEWRRIFMPRGAVLAGRVDDHSWLTVGSSGYLPVMFQGNTVLMVPPKAEAPVRLGYFNRLPSPGAGSPPAGAAAPSRGEAKKDDAKKAEKTPPGWTIAPPGYELRLRMSGLLWPEAAERLANSVYLAREKIQAGQVIFFASSPIFRAGAPGTTRLFTNAVVYGPGMGASQPIVP